MTQLVCIQSLAGSHPAAQVSLQHAVLSFLLSGQHVQSKLRCVCARHERKLTRESSLSKPVLLQLEKVQHTPYN